MIDFEYGVLIRGSVLLSVLLYVRQTGDVGIEPRDHKGDLVRLVLILNTYGYKFSPHCKKPFWCYGFGTRTKIQENSKLIGKNYF